MSRFNSRNVSGAAKSMIVAAGIGVVAGLILMLGGGYFAKSGNTLIGSPYIVAVGAAMLAAAGIQAVAGLATLFERDWGPPLVVPSLAPNAYLEKLTVADRPSWTCTSCRVVQPEAGIDNCVYCDRGTDFYLIESDEDLRMVVAAIS